MAPLEMLFALEIEYHRKLRQEAPGTADAAALHTSYALQSGYEPLLRSVGRVSLPEIERLTERFMATGDTRDVLNACDSVAGLLGLRPYQA